LHVSQTAFYQMTRYFQSCHSLQQKISSSFTSFTTEEIVFTLY